MNGRGVFRLLPGYRIVALPTCSYCRKPDPECECGKPERRKP